MSTKIDTALLPQLAQAEKAEPQREIPVVITMAPGASLTALEQKGLKVRRTFENIPAVSGTATAAEIRELAQSNQVEVIEYDSPAWALSAGDRSH